MVGTPSFVEGDEEVQYVFVSLPTDVDPVAFGPGSTVIIEGLSTEHPTLRPAVAPAAGAAHPPAATTAANGTATSSTSSGALEGMYVDNLGSILLVKEQPQVTHNAKPVYNYLGHTDKQLEFSKPS